MAKEFRDFSNEVSGGSDKIQKSLEGVVTAARGADGAHASLSSAQEKASKSGQSLATSQKAISANMATSAKMSQSTARGISAISGSSRTAATNVGALSGKFSQLGAEASYARQVLGGLGSEIDNLSGSSIDIKANTSDAEKNIQNIVSLLGDLQNKEVGVAVDMSEVEGAVRQASGLIGGIGSSSTIQITADTSGVEQELNSVGSMLDGIQSKEIDITADISGIEREVADIKSQMEESSTIGVVIDTTQIEDGLKDVAEIIEKIQSSDVAVGADISGAEEGLEDVNRMLDELKCRDVCFVVDKSGVESKLGEISEIINELQGSVGISADLSAIERATKEATDLVEQLDGSATVGVTADISEVERGLDRVRVMLGSLQGQEIEINANVFGVEKGLQDVNKMLDGLKAQNLGLGIDKVAVEQGIQDVSKMLDDIECKNVCLTVDMDRIEDSVGKAKDLIDSISPIIHIQMDTTNVEQGLSDITSMLDGLQSRDVSLNLSASGLSSAAKKSSDLTSNLTAAGAAAGNVSMGGRGGGSNFLQGEISSVERLIEELVELEGIKDQASRARFVALTIEQGQLEALSSFVSGLDDAEKAMFESRVESAGLAKAVEELAGSYPLLTARMGKAAAASGEVARTSDTLSRELDSQGDALDSLRDKYNEGVKSAEGFFGGIGASQGMVIGAGVAIAFLGTKVAEIIGEFQDAAVEVAEFGVELSATERRVFGPGVTGQLEDIRDQLSLTRSQAEGFFKVLEDGSSQGVASVGQLVAAGEALRDTFGGDQTERLREYVSLLEELPDIEADMEIGANFDDQAAALFALAKEGKVQTLIDLQAAGLAGGIQLEANQEQANLLNTAQATDKTVQDIKDGMLNKFFPAWGPQFTAISGGVAKGVAIMAGGIATLAALRIFLSRGQSKITDANVDTMKSVRAGTSDVVAAINNQEGDGGGKGNKKVDKAIDKISKKFLGKIGRRGAGRVANRAAITVGGAIGGRGGAMAAGRIASGLSSGDVGKTAKAIGQLGKASLSSSTGIGKMVQGIVKFGKSGFGVGLALTAAGLVVEKSSKLFGDSSKDADAALVKLAGGMLSAAGTVVGFAAIGTAVAGPFGAAIGAVVGALVAAPSLIMAQFETLGTVAEDIGGRLSGTFESVDGRQIAKYNETIQGAGLVMQEFGIGTKETIAGVKSGFGNLWQSTKETAQGLGMMAKENKNLIMLLGPVGLQFRALMGISDIVDSIGDSIRGQEATEEMAKVEKASAELDKSLEKLSRTTKRINQAEARELQRTQEVALALQKELGRTKATFEGLKFTLADFNKDIAAAELDAFGDLGGTAAGFDSALATSSAAIRDKFSQVNKALDGRRAAILSSSKLDGNAREQALNDLHKREIEAVAEFAQGISDLVQKFADAPDILIAEFKESARQAEFDFTVEGGVDAQEFFGGVNEGIETAAKLFERNSQQRIKAEQELGRTQEDIKRKTEETNKVLAAEIPKFGEKVKAALGDAVRETGGGGVEIDQSKAGEAFERLSIEAEKINNEIDDLEDQMNGLNVDRISKAYEAAADDQALATNSAKNLKEEVVKLKDEAKKLVKSGGETAEITRKITDKQKQQADAVKQANDAASRVENEQDKFRSKLLKAGLSIEEIEKAWEAITNREGLANGAMKDAKDAVDKLNEASAKTPEQLKKHRELIDKQKDEVVKAQGALKPLVSAMDNSVQLEREIGQLREAQVQRAEEQRDAIQKMADAVGAITMEQERTLAGAQLQAATASLTGDAIEESNAAFSANNNLLRAQVAAATEGVKRARDYEAELKESVEQQRSLAKEQEALAKAADEAGDTLAAVDFRTAAKIYNKDAKLTAVNAKNAAQAAADLQEEAAGAQESLLEALFDVEGALSQFEDSLSGRRIAAELDLGDALMEAAAFSDEFEEITAQGFAVASKAAKEEARLRAVAVRERIESLEEEAEATAKSLAAGGDVSGANRLRQESKITLQAKKRAELAKIETDQKRKVLAAAEAAADLAREAIDIEDGIIDAQMDFLTQVGGNFESVLQLQNKSVGLEREKLRIAEEELARAREGGAAGVELRKKESAVILQQLNLRKKEFGVQKDIFEGIIGKAFGELRSDFGARKQRFSEVAMLGVEGSRVRRSSGIRTGGKVQTIAERAADRQLAGFGDRGQARGGIIGRADGGLGKAPTKTTEEGIFGATKESAGYNKTTAEKMAALSDAGTKPGSIFTHDMTVEGKLDILIDVMKAMQGEDVLDEDSLNRTIAGAGEQRSGGVFESLLEVGKGIFDAILAIEGADSDSEIGRELAIIGASVSGGLAGIQQRTIKGQAEVAKAQSQTAVETAGAKAAIEDVSKETKKAGEKASEGAKAAKEGTAAGVVTAMAVGQGTETQRKSLSQQLNIARKDLDASLGQLKAIQEGGDSKKFEKASAETEGKLNQVLDLESSVRQQEIRNPIAGAFPQVAELGRIMSGGLPDQVEEFEGLLDIEKEAAGKAKETEVKRKDLTERQRDIAEGKGPMTAARQMGGAFLGGKVATAQAQIDAMKSGEAAGAVKRKAEMPREELTPMAKIIQDGINAGLGDEGGGILREDLGIGASKGDALAAAEDLEMRAYDVEGKNAALAKTFREDAETIRGNIGKTAASPDSDAALAAAEKLEYQAYDVEGTDAEKAKMLRKEAEAIRGGITAVPLSEGVGDKATASPNGAAVPEDTIIGAERDAVTNRAREVGSIATPGSAAFSTVAGVGGTASGAGGGSTMTMKIQGELTVRFTGIPKSYAATLVGQVINTGEIVDSLSKSLQDRGFLKKA